MAAVLSHIYTISTVLLTFLLLELLVFLRTLFKFFSFRSTSSPTNLFQLIEDIVPSTLYKIRTLASESPECAVCLSKFEEGDEIRKLKCKHTFHKDCLDRWLEQDQFDTTCPLCRREVLPKDVVGMLRLRLVEDQYDGSDEELVFLLSALQGSNLHTLL